MYEYLNRLKQMVQNDIGKENYPGALWKIKKYAGLAYEFNQFYTDAMIENSILVIERKLNVPDNLRKVSEKNVLFYDGFWNVDTRGLAIIYLEALFALGYDVYYVTSATAKGQKPETESLIKRNNGKIIYITESLDDSIGMYKALCKAFEYVKPKHAFLYIYPNDVSAVMTFNRYKNVVRRYQIDLTDHAFWLGINAFDFCCSSWQFGTSVAYNGRKIPKEKIVLSRFYPLILEDCEFSGFPFQKDDNDFVIFSGGSVYKTMDTEKTYYKMVRNILDRFPRTKFWYAGDTLQDDMKDLINCYPNRAFFTGERKDLVPVLENVDMYLNTYPIHGGLMVQYSAVAGKAPFTLVFGDTTRGMLLDDDKLDIYYDTIDELVEDVGRYIDDPVFRKNKNDQMKGRVCTKDRFTSELSDLMLHGKTSWPIKTEPCNAEKFKRIYAERCRMKYNL